MSPVFNQTITKELQVGELRKVVTVSSTRPDLSFEDLVAFANLALEENSISSCEDVSIELNVEGIPAKPFVGAVAKPTRDPFAEVLVAVFGPSRGTDLYDRLKRADSQAERASKEARESEKFNSELECRTSQMEVNAFDWFNAKVNGTKCDRDGMEKVLHTGAREIAKGWAHVQMLQEKIVHMEKNHLDGVELINAYKAQINELQQLMGKRAEEHEAQIRELHGTSVAANRAFDREREARIAAEKELEEVNRKIKRMKDYAVRLNSVC